MNIVVCIKQVPEIALVRVDETSGVILPDGPGGMNPFDEYAVEEALRLKEKNGGTVTVIGCGGETAVAGLRDAIALGADRAILLIDPAFEGSDGVAIGSILAAGVRKIGAVDLCLFGKNAIDTDRSVVPGATAGKLGWAQVLFVKKIELVEPGKLTVARMTEDGFDRVATPLPAVISVVKEINEPRLPSLKGKMKSKSAPIDRWGAADIGIDPATVGANSLVHATVVKAPPPRKRGARLEGDPAAVASALFEKLREEKVI
ncbi:MAG: electron transfer flavoprotein subunit beta/FixA family protein [candidate division Zixibacteria bacterium]|nr:electron transfer flavoprotein subunit beta/FixA family protein [candidate division Zixibacteria bacterium]